MTTILEEPNYVTLINYFSVASNDKEAFARLELEEINKHWKKKDGAITASVHKSLSGNRVFDYAHWDSQAALDKWQQSDAFKEHIESMSLSHLDFEPDPRIYEVVSIVSDESAPKISDQLVTTLTMIWAQPNTQSGIVEQLKEAMQSLATQKPKEMVFSHLLRSSDEERVAIYAQWQNENAAEGSPFGLKVDFLDAVDELIEDSETLAYEVVGTY